MIPTPTAGSMPSAVLRRRVQLHRLWQLPLLLPTHLRGGWHRLLSSLKPRNRTHRGRPATGLTRPGNAASAPARARSWRHLGSSQMPVARAPATRSREAQVTSPVKATAALVDVPGYVLVVTMEVCCIFAIETLVCESLGSKRGDPRTVCNLSPWPGCDCDDSHHRTFPV